MQQRNYTVAMVADLWGTSDTFVYEQIKSGRLRAFKLGNKLWRVPPDALDEYEQAAAYEPPTPSDAPVVRDPREVAAIARLIRAEVAKARD